MTLPAAPFVWGAATAAYQIEGAPYDDGKGPGIWDVFCRIPGRTVAGDTGELACDHYQRWRDDIKLMQELGLQAYRLSISWPRVMPGGRGAVNEKGLAFYANLIDGLLAAGITPFVTCYHWDLPAALQFELGGWANPEIAHVFADYAELLFNRLGDRVKNWMTLNEPWVVVDAGYFAGVHPPGVKDPRIGYLAGHNLMRAHAHAVARYRAGKHGNGKISFALNTSYSFPKTDSEADRTAAERAVQAFGGWFTDPPYFGDYPAVMRERLGDMLPQFTGEEQRLLKGSMDYLALNYYTSDQVAHSPGNGPFEIDRVLCPGYPRTEMDWPIVPEGFRLLLHWLAKRYPGLPIYITENGAAMPDRADANGFVADDDRIDYLRTHIGAMQQAAREGVPMAGYFCWSLMDNLEWSAGYAKRFGLIHCDRATMKRTIKKSGLWYRDLILQGGGGR